MEAYNDFAKVYNLFMDNIPYQGWSEYIRELLLENDVKDGIVLDLGCGTGQLTNIMSDYGYDMIGIDISDEMLNIAMESKEDRNILYLCQDMTEFELYGTVKAVISICDSMNYVTNDDDLLNVFKLVNNYLDPGGIFIFDLNTEYKYKEVIGESTIAENRDNASFIWDNYYDEESRINEYELTLFIKEEDSELFRKHEEIHYQRAYEIEEVTALIEKSGLKLLNIFDAFTHDAPKEDSERLYFICKEINKRC